MKLINGNFKILRKKHGSFVTIDDKPVKKTNKRISEIITEIVDHTGSIELTDGMDIDYADYMVIFDAFVRMKLKKSTDRSEHFILEMVDNAEAKYIFLEKRRYAPIRAMMHYDLFGKPLNVVINADILLFTEKCREMVKQFIDTKKTLF